MEDNPSDIPGSWQTNFNDDAQQNTAVPPAHGIDHNPSDIQGTWSQNFYDDAQLDTVLPPAHGFYDLPAGAGPANGYSNAPQGTAHPPVQGFYDLPVGARPVEDAFSASDYSNASQGITNPPAHGEDALSEASWPVGTADPASECVDAPHGIAHPPAHSMDALPAGTLPVGTFDPALLEDQLKLLNSFIYLHYKAKGYDNVCRGLLDLPMFPKKPQQDAAASGSELPDLQFPGDGSAPESFLEDFCFQFFDIYNHSRLTRSRRASNAPHMNGVGDEHMQQPSQAMSPGAHAHSMRPPATAQEQGVQVAPPTHSTEIRDPAQGLAPPTQAPSDSRPAFSISGNVSPYQGPNQTWACEKCYLRALENPDSQIIPSLNSRVLDSCRRCGTSIHEGGQYNNCRGFGQGTKKHFWKCLKCMVQHRDIFIPLSVRFCSCSSSDEVWPFTGLFGKNDIGGVPWSPGIEKSALCPICLPRSHFRRLRWSGSSHGKCSYCHSVWHRSEDPSVYPPFLIDYYGTDTRVSMLWSDDMLPTTA